jgi:hypothetical protein
MMAFPIDDGKITNVPNHQLDQLNEIKHEHK